MFWRIKVKPKDGTFDTKGHDVYKSIVDLGHIPKADDISSRSWLYGKLFLGLLTEKLIRIGRSFSPWGYALEAQQLQSIAEI